MKNPRERSKGASIRGAEPRAARGTLVAMVAAGTAAAVALAVFMQARGGADRQAPSTAAVSSREGSGGPIVYGYRIVNVYPHDPEAFTQGLIFKAGFLFESTGLNGRSSLRKVRLEDGVVVQEHRLADEHFAEGLTDWSGRLFQLTWQPNLGFVYDLETFTQVRTFRYAGEGWGLARDERRLVMSDGTPNLRFLDPETLAQTGELLVHHDGIPVPNLNELELVNGEIFANVWQTDYIVTVDRSSGRVTGRIDLGGLLSPAERAATDVMNGIAHDPAGGRLFVTGKLWPKLFEIRLEPRS
jgi:glutaminyl-peptide cyclotransferase